MEYHVDGLDGMKDLAKKIAPHITKGDVVFLRGDIGSGKTTLMKFLLKFLKVKTEVVSPTFAIVNVHKKSKIGKINHFDLYRIEELDELREIGFDELLCSGTSFIEWPEIIENKVKDVKEVYITKLDDNQRMVKLWF